MRRARRIEPGPGQESVWDYPRPPRVERTDLRVRIVHRGAVVADSVCAWRVLETSQAPAYYLPPDDVATELLRPAGRRSACEWKGTASYFDVVVHHAVEVAAAWSYRSPATGFEPIADHIAFYAQQLDDCSVDGERVGANEGDFYGGWVTSWIVGPFKGGPGTLGW